MKYRVEVWVDTTVVVEVEAGSPEEAMENYSLENVDCGELYVTGSHPLSAADEKGEITESGW